MFLGFSFGIAATLAAFVTQEIPLTFPACSAGKNKTNSGIEITRIVTVPFSRAGFLLSPSIREKNLAPQVLHHAHHRELQTAHSLSKDDHSINLLAAN